MFHRTPIASALLALCAAPIATTAIAQTAPAPAAAASAPASTLQEVRVKSRTETDEYNPGTATIGGKAPAALRDIPQTITVVNRAVLDAQGANSLQEALRNVPGISISAGEGGAIGDNINLRGFSARTDVFLDGFRDRGQYTRDTFSLDAVEVLKGPSSMLFGRGSTGGVINQVSKKPQRADLTEVGLTLGTENYKRATLDVNRGLSETSAFRVAVMAQDSESTRDVVSVERFGLAPSLRLGMGTPTEITLSALLQRGRDVPDYGVPFLRNGSDTVGAVRTPAAVPANRYFGYADDYFNQDVAVLTATVQHRFSDRLTLRNQTQLSRSTTEASPTPLGTVSVVDGAPDGTLVLHGTPLSLLEAVRGERTRHFTDRSLANQTDLIAKFDTGGVAHTLTTGAEIGWDRYEVTNYNWTVPDGTVNLGDPVLMNRPGTTTEFSKGDNKSSTLALYANDEIALTTQWKLVAGLRWDRFKPEATTIEDLDTTPVSTTLRPETQTFVSTRAGLIYQPTLTQSYYVSLGTSFNPTGETLTVNERDVALDPEKNRSFEIGAKWDLLDGGLSVNGALFRVDKTNARTRDPVTGLNQLDGEVRVQGLELGITGRVLPQWQLFAGYTLLDGKVLKSIDVGSNLDAGLLSEGKTLQNTPRHSATLWSTYELGGGWEVGGGVVASSDRWVNNFETAKIEGYTRLDATLAYKQPTWDVRLNLLNLNDELYHEVASGGRATPAEGRQVRVTTNFRF